MKVAIDATASRVFLSLITGCAFLLVAAPAAVAAPPARITICHVDPGEPPTYVQLNDLPVGVAERHLANHSLDTTGSCGFCNRCDDANPCTSDTCGEHGSCINTPVSCDDGDSCTIDACIPEQGGCVAVPNEGASCDDGDVCTGPSDTCEAGGQCGGAPIAGCCRSDADCSDGDACTDDFCDEPTGQCSHAAVVCVATEQCEVAVCDAELGCLDEPVDCPDDGDICTVEVCDTDIGSQGTCVPLPNPAPPEPGAEVTCGDGLDNDCDGAIDASDSDCAPPPTVCPCVTLGVPYWDGAAYTPYCYSGPGPGGAVVTGAALTSFTSAPSGPSVGYNSIVEEYGCGRAESGVGDVNPDPGQFFEPGSPEEEACLERIREILIEDGGTLCF